MNCMKLRIRGNSIRLRLTKSDIAQFADTGSVEERVDFGFAKPALSYRLDRMTDDDMTRARFEDDCLSISIPAAAAESWIKSEQVSIEAAQPIGENKVLRILVEKDFACLAERVNEDDSDAFTNPIRQTLRNILILLSICFRLK